MKKVLLFCLCLALTGTMVTAADNSFSVNSDTEAKGGSIPLVPGPNSITQSVDTSTITSPNSVSCNAGGFHADNDYLRRFFLNTDHGIVGAFLVTSVDWARENGGGIVATDITVSSNSLASGAPFTFANMVVLDTTGFADPPAGPGALNTPLGGTIVDPVADDLVIDIFTADNQAGGASFFIGSNPNGETQPSYLAAADCGITEPTSTTAIGFPSMHIIMVVNGDEAGGVPTMGGWGLLLLALVLAFGAVGMVRRSSEAV